MCPVLEVKYLSHKFGPVDVLKNISFTLPVGKVFSVVGPSGGGKTTLLHLCAGLLDIEEGSVQNSFCSFAFAFQDPRLLPWKTALDNIAYGLKARGVGKEERRELARTLGLRFGLEEKDFLKFPKDLSGGMRQRVSFARAMVIEPDLLFLDEPFSALDIGLKQELQSTLMEMVLEKKLTVLFITHDLMEAVRLSDRIYLLAAEPGRIVSSYDIDQPLAKRENSFVYDQTARLLKEKEIIKTFELRVNA